MKKILGYVMLSLVFVGLFAATVMEVGLYSALITWVASIFTAVFIIAALWFITEG